MKPSFVITLKLEVGSAVHKANQVSIELGRTVGHAPFGGSALTEEGVNADGKPEYVFETTEDPSGKRIPWHRSESLQHVPLEFDGKRGGGV